MIFDIYLSNILMFQLILYIKQQTSTKCNENSHILDGILHLQNTLVFIVHVWQVILNGSIYHQIQEHFAYPVKSITSGICSYVISG